MMISSDISWDSFNTAIVSRLGNPAAGLSMEFEDSQEDGEKVFQSLHPCKSWHSVHG